jgi:hypothetical protein
MSTLSQALQFATSHDATVAPVVTSALNGGM